MRNVQNLIESEESVQGLSLFSNEIINAPLPENFKMHVIPSCEGLTDPNDHLDAFNDYIWTWHEFQIFLVASVL